MSVGDLKEKSLEPNGGHDKKSGLLVSVRMHEQVVSYKCSDTIMKIRKKNFKRND